MSILETSVAILSHLCKIKLEAVGLSQNHSVAREFHLINSPGEGRLDLNSVAVENIFAAGVPDQDSPIVRKFPNHRVCIPGHTPFTDDVVGRSPATDNPTQQNCHGSYHQSGLMSGEH